MFEIMLWWFVCGYCPTAIGALLAVLALRSPRYGYHGRHHGRYVRSYRVGYAQTHKADEHQGGYRPSDLTPFDLVVETRLRLDARARAAERETRPTTYGSRRALPPDVTPELARYDQSAGSTSYLRLSARGVAPVKIDRSARITTAEMTAMFGAELASVLAPPIPDEWLAEPESVGV